MPGLTALTRSGASSAASGRTAASRAPLTAARPAVPGDAACAEAAVTNVTDPARVRCDSAACTASSWAKVLAANARRSTVRSRAANGPAPNPPLTHTTRWSISPRRSNSASS